MAGGAEAGEDEGQRSGTNVFGEEAAQPLALNLTALMDILSNLLFFLLACFGTTIVMGINATVPVQSSDQSSLADTKQTVTAAVSLRKDGLDVSVTGSAQPQQELDSWRRRIPLRDGDPDYQELSAYLMTIKRKYPRSDTMILTPEPGMSYDTMVKTMDAARETEVTVSGVARPLPLFPTVVVSTVIK
jgi:biopolymer transport protein ExbD